jgi:hypothetical protein
MTIVNDFALKAANGIRTRDPQLGKLVLYQLSYRRAEPDSTGKAVRGPTTGRRLRVVHR